MHLDPDVGIFGAVDALTVDAWESIAKTIGPGGFCGLLRPSVGPVPHGWLEVYRSPLLQMVTDDVAFDRPGADIVELGPRDVPEMIRLVEVTTPAPFAGRTPELGRYVGVREEGRLIAMGGERLKLPGLVEISAICTHPDHRSRGLATSIVSSLVRSIHARGSAPFLHVEESNQNAARLYRALGFSVRTQMEVVFAQYATT